MAEEQAEKTEPATPKRREEARRKGEVAQSREIQSVVILAAALLAFGSFLGANLSLGVGGEAQALWSGARTPPSSLADYHALILEVFKRTGVLMLPVLALMLVTVTLVQLLQTGPLFSLQAMEFKLDRLDPFKGMKRMVSPERLVDLAKALFKVGLVGATGWLVVGNEVDMLVGLGGAPMSEAMGATGSVARRLTLAVVVVLGVLALADLLYQRWRYEKKLRMSKHEVREELKQREGDPMVRSRFRAMQRELSRSRMIAAVAEADVVITNPTHFAVALRYERETMKAPEVVAKGRNHVALRIREAAVQAGVAVVENPPLARLLHKTGTVGREIPENLYQAVAETLAYVYRLDPRRGRGWSAAS